MRLSCHDRWTTAVFNSGKWPSRCAWLPPLTSWWWWGWIFIFSSFVFSTFRLFVNDRPAVLDYPLWLESSWWWWWWSCTWWSEMLCYAWSSSYQDMYESNLNWFKRPTSLRLIITLNEHLGLLWWCLTDLIVWKTVQKILNIRIQSMR